MFTKTIVRLLILSLFLASALIVTISTWTEAFLSPLSLSTNCNISPGDDETTAKATVYYNHPYLIDNIIGPHWHSFSYSAYARVNDQEDKNPPDGDYGNESVNSWTRFFQPKTKVAFVSGIESYENDAYASASASESGNDDNSDFCPELW